MTKEEVFKTMVPPCALCGKERTLDDVGTTYVELCKKCQREFIKMYKRTVVFSGILPDKSATGEMAELCHVVTTYYEKEKKARKEMFEVLKDIYRW